MNLFNLMSNNTQIHIKTDEPGSHDFRQFVSQFSTHSHTIFQKI